MTQRTGVSAVPRVLDGVADGVLESVPGHVDTVAYPESSRKISVSSSAWSLITTLDTTKWDNGTTPNQLNISLNHVYSSVSVYDYRIHPPSLVGPAGQSQTRKPN